MGSEIAGARRSAPGRRSKRLAVLLCALLAGCWQAGSLDGWNAGGDTDGTYGGADGGLGSDDAADTDWGRAESGA